MSDSDKTKEQLLKELEEVRRQLAESKAQEAYLRQSEGAIEESPWQLANIIDFFPDATFAINKEGTVIAWNRAIEEMTGVRAEDMLRKGNYEYAIPFYGTRRPILIDLILMPDKEIEAKYTIINKEKDILIAESDFPRLRGERRVLWAKVSLIYDIRGDIAGAIELIRDITAHKKAEETWQEASERTAADLKERTSELEAANEDLKKFTFSVSHDLRAPLINLKGFAQELRMSMETIQPSVEELLPSLDAKKGEEVRVAIREDVPEALEFIESSVTRMDNLINSVLKLSRLGRRDLTFEPINMNDLVDDTLKTIAHQIAKHHARVSVESLPEVTADRISMQQIIGNLLDNALKYLAPDRAGEISIRGAEGDKFTTFYIQDNGRGIAENDTKKIFEIFRRVGTQDVPGEGMGLTYVQAMVKRHGGNIWCESKPGAGATFTFTISKKLMKGN
ncbi:MAG: ATP-binding protein [Smithella sp.]